MIVKFLKHEDMRAATVAAAVLWALAPSSHLRASIAELGGVTALHGLLVRTLKACSSYKHGVCSCAGSSAKCDNGYQVVLLATSECVIQAILYGELGSRRCESEVVLVSCSLICRQRRKHHNRVDSRKRILPFTPG
jgi:hypothetical protein